MKRSGAIKESNSGLQSTTMLKQLDVKALMILFTPTSYKLVLTTLFFETT